MQSKRINRTELYIEINEFNDITHDEVSSMLKLVPSKAYFRDKESRENNLNSSSINRWLLDVSKDNLFYSSFEEQMDHTLEVINSRLDSFTLLSNKYSLCIKCAVIIFFNNGQSIPSVFLERRHCDLLSRLGAEFDVDIYCFSKYPPKIKKRPD